MATVSSPSQALITLETLVTATPPDLRKTLDGLTRMALIERCAGFRPGPVTTPLAATRHALRGLARQWQQLHVEVRDHEQHLAALTEAVAPAVVAAFGIGQDTAAEMLIEADDDPGGVRSESAGPRCVASALCPRAAAGRAATG